MKADVLIVGSGLAGISCALSLPRDKSVILITKKKLDDCNSSLAQGGICVQHGDDDRESFIEDTLRAGHFENKREAVEVLVDESRPAIESLIEWGVVFDKDGDDFDYTREGGHSGYRILHCKDHSGASIMEAVIRECKGRENIKIIEDCAMVDLLVYDKSCYGVVAERDGKLFEITALYTVLATGGVGGLFENSTSFRHLTADGMALALSHDVDLKDVSWVQIHPTSFYEATDDRRFLISESVRGEGAILVNNGRQTFVDSLLPRDIVSQAIFQEMAREGSEHVWLTTEKMTVDMSKRFPKIFNYLLDHGIDARVEAIPVVPAQHFMMGGIETDLYGRTSMNRLYAVGEVACTGVHGHNRLASNSLLECVVYGKRAAQAIADSDFSLNLPKTFDKVDLTGAHEKISEMVKW